MVRKPVNKSGIWEKKKEMLMEVISQTVNIQNRFSIPVNAGRVHSVQSHVKHLCSLSQLTNGC